VNNTLVVFLSDNGGKILQAGNNAPLMDDKGSTHEGGIRVPMFMHWPGKLPVGQVFEHPVLALDLYPTFAGLASAEIPDNKMLDGEDIWADLKEGRNPHRDETIFWLRHHGGGNEIAIRHGDLKAYRKNFGNWQVFDVTSDVGESSDLAKANSNFLKQRIPEGASWAKTHLEPQWHDTEGSLKSWIENDMPKYDESFALKSPQISAAITEPPKRQAPTDWTKAEYIAVEKIKWKKNGWRWNLSKVESNFAEIDTNNDGIASGKERQAWFANKKGN
jgi:arylsulfatase A-like enzyme